MRSEEMLAAIRGMRFDGRDAGRPLTLMEVCGTHTMAIAKAGLRQLLPPSVRLISGPGCPVCVTPAGALDAVLDFAMREDVILTSYGDLLRVPGSRRGDHLLARRAKGADVRMVYSPMDALELAKKTPGKQIVFLAVGFETTAPGTAACILTAQEENADNFSVLCLMKYTVPALRAILNDPACSVDGLICPGHVAAITGSDAFDFIPREYGLPAAVGGFDGGDVIAAVHALCDMRAKGIAQMVNCYERVVSAQGNRAALAAMEAVFEPADDVWRGLGLLPMSGMRIREAYSRYDAAKRFNIEGLDRDIEKAGGCRCGDVLRGVIAPQECPLFGRVCTPADPVGPCMVSGEGACAAAYKYQGIV
ncbi:MAG: hydrogenase formation protein HypD [Clostridia bacterium]|nr:hydrogenase formation protein HypD [Clostridia bacterium]